MLTLYITLLGQRGSGVFLFFVFSYRTSVTSIMHSKLKRKQIEGVDLDVKEIYSVQIKLGLYAFYVDMLLSRLIQEATAC